VEHVHASWGRKVTRNQAGRRPKGRFTRGGRGAPAKKDRRTPDRSPRSGRPMPPVSLTAFDLHYDRRLPARNSSTAPATIRTSNPNAILPSPPPPTRNRRELTLRQMAVPRPANAGMPSAPRRVDTRVDQFAAGPIYFRTLNTPAPLWEGPILIMEDPPGPRGGAVKFEHLPRRSPELARSTAARRQRPEIAALTRKGVLKGDEQFNRRRIDRKQGLWSADSEKRPASRSAPADGEPSIFAPAHRQAVFWHRLPIRRSGPAKQMFNPKRRKGNRDCFRPGSGSGPVPQSAGHTRARGGGAPKGGQEESDGPGKAEQFADPCERRRGESESEIFNGLCISRKRAEMIGRGARDRRQNGVSREKLRACAMYGSGCAFVRITETGSAPADRKPAPPSAHAANDSPRRGGRSLFLGVGSPGGQPPSRAVRPSRSSAARKDGWQPVTPEQGAAPRQGPGAHRYERIGLADDGREKRAPVQTGKGPSRRRRIRGREGSWSSINASRQNQRRAGGALAMGQVTLPARTPFVLGGFAEVGDEARWRDRPCGERGRIGGKEQTWNRASPASPFAALPLRAAERGKSRRASVSGTDRFDQRGEGHSDTNRLHGSTPVEGARPWGRGETAGRKWPSRQRIRTSGGQDAVASGIGHGETRDSRVPPAAGRELLEFTQADAKRQARRPWSLRPPS